MVDITEDVVADFRRVLKAFTDGDLWPTEIITQQLIEADCWTAGLMWGKFKLDDDHKARDVFFSRSFPCVLLRRRGRKRPDRN